jgi:formylglycine-generating enzyme required for sulfatase activity
MVFVPEGEFLMGSPDSDDMASDDEKPQHTVMLDAFWIDRYEVLNAQYAACVRAESCAPPSSTSSSSREMYYGNPEYDAYPVIHVSWEDARRYCEWAGQRLPTQAEWEKAARGTGGQMYPWGNEFIRDYVNADGVVGDTTAVGAYPQGISPYGALDMSGNVWEWVNDWYDPGYYANSPTDNPPGPSEGEYRVLRGGSYSDGPGSVRAAAHNDYSPDSNNNELGFRCAE